MLETILFDLKFARCKLGIMSLYQFWGEKSELRNVNKSLICEI